MKPLIEPPALLEALKYANPLPPKTNLVPIAQPTPAGTKISGNNLLIIFGFGLLAIGLYCRNQKNKKHKSNKNRS